MSSVYDGRADGVDEAQLDSQLHDMMAMAHSNALLPDLSADMMPLDLDLGDVPDVDPTTGAAAYDQGHGMHTHTVDTDNSAIHGVTQDDPNNLVAGPGAGPLPASYGVQLPPNAGSTLTEFTKRRNWSQRVIEELKDFLHILTPDGAIIYVSPSSKMLTGYDSDQLVGQFISDYIHPDDTSIFVREFNESIASGNPLRFFYRFRKADGSYSIFESHGHPHFGSEAAAFGPHAGASFCRGFFMMARQYPTKNAALLDSFLEHKIENERLKRRIANLKREEQEELEGQQKNWNKAKEIETNSAGGSTTHAPNPSNTSPDYHGMPPPAKPSISNTALTRQNLNEALAASRPDSINDKMARYEGATHVETIEMLTGLRYREGERSKGISTGSSSPALIRGDAGIPIHVDKDGRPMQRGDNHSPFDGSFSDKKKKMKVADEHVCTDCGTLDSPEWRKGPNGPKTLCNACGLRWAKKEKKRSGLAHSAQQQNGDASGHGSNHADTPTGSTPAGTPVAVQAQGQHMNQMHGQMHMRGGMNPQMGMMPGASMGNMPP